MQAYLNLLEGIVNHGDQHVEEDNHHGDVVNTVEDITDVLNEFVSIIDDDRLDLGQTKYSPEQCLKALLQSKQMHGKQKGQEEERKAKVTYQEQSNPKMCVCLEQSM